MYATNEPASAPAAAAGSFQRRTSYLDASAFLELERGLSDKSRKDLDGVEAAVLAATTAAVDSSRQLHKSASSQLRVSKASLDKISAAGRAGSLSAFGAFREDTLLAMDSIRDLQERVFEDHMRFDVFDESNDIDVGAKDFLPRYTAAHALKEAKMQEITASLGQLAQRISDAGAKLAGVIDPLSSAAQPSSSFSADQHQQHSAAATAAPKMTLKAAAGRMIEHKRVERAKKDTMLRDLVKDAKLLGSINAAAAADSEMFLLQHSLFEDAESSSAATAAHE